VISTTYGTMRNTHSELKIRREFGFRTAGIAAILSVLLVLKMKFLATLFAV